jgi:uncharacterized protein with GYD domain
MGGSAGREGRFPPATHQDPQGSAQPPCREAQIGGDCGLKAANPHALAREVEHVPKYVLLSTLTPEGRKTLHQHPERIRAVDDEIATFGCKVIEQYAVLGPYDFVTVVEGPDNETVAHLSVDLGSRGTVNMMTLPAISIDDFAAQLTRSEQLGHK